MKEYDLFYRNHRIIRNKYYNYFGCIDCHIYGRLENFKECCKRDIIYNENISVNNK